MAQRHLQSDKPADANARRRTNDPPDVWVGAGQSSQLLPELATEAAAAGTGGVAGCDPATGIERSTLWVPADRAVIEAGRLAGESQTGVAAHARRQPAEHSTPAVRDHDRQQPWLAGVSESGTAHGGHWAQSTVGGRYHLRSVTARVHLSGGGRGWCIRDVWWDGTSAVAWTVVWLNRHWNRRSSNGSQFQA